MNISAIVLAAGLSKRMGENKLLKEIKGKKIYQFILDTIGQAGFKEVIVVARDEEILIDANRRGFQAYDNPNAEYGQSTSIKVAMNHVSDHSLGYMFFVADQPFVSLDTIHKMTDQFIQDTESILIPLYEGIKGNPVLFSAKYHQDLSALEGDVGGRALLVKYPDKVKYVLIYSKNEGIDIDTRETYLKYTDESR